METEKTKQREEKGARDKLQSQNGSKWHRTREKPERN